MCEAIVDASLDPLSEPLSKLTTSENKMTCGNSPTAAYGLTSDRPERAKRRSFVRMSPISDGAESADGESAAARARAQFPTTIDLDEEPECIFGGMDGMSFALRGRTPWIASRGRCRGETHSADVRVAVCHSMGPSVSPLTTKPAPAPAPAPAAGDPWEPRLGAAPYVPPRPAPASAAGAAAADPFAKGAKSPFEPDDESPEARPRPAGPTRARAATFPRSAAGDSDSPPPRSNPIPIPRRRLTSEDSNYL
eukprot:tig00020943_g16289.t1